MFSDTIYHNSESSKILFNVLDFNFSFLFLKKKKKERKENDAYTYTLLKDIKLSR